MSEYSNPWALSYSAVNEHCVALFEEAVTSYLAARADTMTAVDAVLAEDPDMVMALCFKGYLLRLAAHPQFKQPLAAVIERAAAQAAAGNVNLRERQHVEALTLWCRDRSDQALDCLEAILAEYPMDMLALRIAHYIHFYNGRGEDMCDSTGRILAAWDEQHPHFHYLQGMHAFGLEEAGQYGQALQYGRAAVDANPQDIWATHAVTHVFQMQAQHTEGLAWLDGLRDQWQSTNNFRNHVIWHGALHHLGLDAPEEALRIYDEQLTESVNDDFYLDICNNAALLWRLQFLGIDVGDRWDAMVEICQRHIRDQELVFASLHYLIPLAVTGAEGARALVQTIREWAAFDTHQGRVCAKVGASLADAIVESIDTPAAAAQVLVTQQPQAHLIGGSKAQRDLFRLLADSDAQRAQLDELIGAWPVST